MNRDGSKSRGRGVTHKRMIKPDCGVGGGGLSQKGGG